MDDSLGNVHPIDLFFTHKFSILSLEDHSKTFSDCYPFKDVFLGSYLGTLPSVTPYISATSQFLNVSDKPRPLKSSKQPFSC